MGVALRRRGWLEREEIYIYPIKTKLDVYFADGPNEERVAPK